MQNITVRDYLAANASEEDVEFWINSGVKKYPAREGNRWVVVEEGTKRTREEARYAYADAMIKAREKKE